MDHDTFNKLKDIVGEERCSAAAAERFVYGFDASIYGRDADAVVRPQTTAEVAAIVRLANEKKIPLLSRGGGTGLCGNAVPVAGGIVIDMREMNAIKTVAVEDLYCVAEPGVIYKELNDALKPHGFFFPPSPGSGDMCTIGGMVGTNASGMRAVKYGATRDCVLGLEVVMPDGEIVRYGTRTIKNSSGYQMEKLLVGSEGTLGIVTEVTLKIAPLPETAAMVLASFASVQDAGRCVSAIVARGITPAALEIMDELSICAVNKAQGQCFPDRAALIVVELDGTQAQVDADCSAVAALCKEHGATSLEETADPQRMAAITKGRKSIMSSLSRYGENEVSVSLADDMSVPISKIADAITAFQAIYKQYDVTVGTYGHAGDGNLHTKFLVNPRKRDDWVRAEQAVAAMYDAVLALGGTVSGEHGIGLSKAPYMKKERAQALGPMTAIKQALDPNNIMNPGKLMQAPDSIIANLRYPDNTIAERYAALEQELLACTYCGTCKTVCPTFDSTVWESAVARGRVILATGLAYGRLTPDASVAAGLYRCTTCKRCESVCPSSVKLVDLIEESRRVVFPEAGLEKHKKLVASVAQHGNPFGETATRLAAFGTAPKKAKIGYFMGCMGGYREQDIPRAAFALFEALDIEYTAIDEVCCGSPLRRVGVEDISDLVAHNIAAIEALGVETVVFSCPGCYRMFKQEYPDIQTYDFAVMHITEFLAEKLEEGALQLTTADGTLTYHDPCHLGRHLGIYDAPRALLTALYGKNFIEMDETKEQAACCGAGGGLKSGFGEAAQRIGTRRTEQAKKTAETLTTACPFCYNMFKTVDAMPVISLEQLLHKALQRR